MTGRRLYEMACDTRHKYDPRRAWGPSGAQNFENHDWVSWPFLHGLEKRFWNDVARRITPKPKGRT